MAKQRKTNLTIKARSIRKVASILQKAPGMVKQVSTTTLQQVKGSPAGGPSADIAIKGELERRSTSGDYESASIRKRSKRPFRPA